MEVISREAVHRTGKQNSSVREKGTAGNTSAVGEEGASSPGENLQPAVIVHSRCVKEEVIVQESFALKKV